MRSLERSTVRGRACYPSRVPSLALRAALGVGACLVAALTGCPPPSSPMPDIGPPLIGPDGALLWLEVGTGSDRFVPLASGAELELVHGSQGGWHVELAVRMTGSDPEGSILRLQVLDEGGVLVAETPIAIISRRLVREGWTWLRTGDIVILSMPDPPAVLDHDVTVRAVLEIGGAIVAADQRAVHIVDRL